MTKVVENLIDLRSLLFVVCLTTLQVTRSICCQIFWIMIKSWGTAVAQWLRPCAANRKVAGSIRDGVIGIFH